MTTKDRKRILVIDDDLLIRDLLKRNVELFKPAYQVDTAQNGEAALEKFRQHSFDLVVTDYQMPGPTGLELARAIRRLSPATRIVLMTGANLLQFDGLVELELLDGYVQKPFTLKQILNVLEALVE